MPAAPRNCARRGALGARVIYISARRRQRSKAFRLALDAADRRALDRISGVHRGQAALPRTTQARAAAPPRRALSRCHLFALRRRRGFAALLSHVRLHSRRYVLVVPGGGTGHPGGARRAGSNFWRPRALLRRAGIVTVFVGPAQRKRVRVRSGRRAVQICGSWARCRNRTSLALMRGARLVVTNGGSTLLQAIACGAACVAVPIARDQVERIRRCVAAGVAVEARSMPRASARPQPPFGTMRPAVPHSRGGLPGSRSPTASKWPWVRSASSRIEVASKRVSCRMQCCWATISISRHFGTACAVWSAPLEAAGWQVRAERFPSGRYGLRTWERRGLLAGRTSRCCTRSS